MTRKFNYQLFKAFLPALFLLGCTSGNSPEKSAERFLNAFNAKKYDEARKYATPETIKLVDLMENLSKMSSSVDSIQHKKIEAFDAKIDGDSAMVSFREEGSAETEQLKLKKIDGTWLVHITKTDITAKENSVFNTENDTEFEMESGEAGEVPSDSAAIE